VLVVDDDPVVRRMLAWLLAQEGYSVRQAGSGPEALDVLSGTGRGARAGGGALRPPDCMVLDLMMPGVSGQTVLHRRQAEGLAPAMRVLVLTAKNDPVEEAWCAENGADGFLTKPFDGEHLVRLVGELVRLGPR